VDHRPALLAQIDTFANKIAALHWGPSKTFLRRATNPRARPLLLRSNQNGRVTGVIERVREVGRTSVREMSDHERSGMAVAGTGVNVSLVASGTVRIARGATEVTEIVEETTEEKMTASVIARGKSGRENRPIKLMGRRNAPDVEAAPF